MFALSCEETSPHRCHGYKAHTSLGEHEADHSCRGSFFVLANMLAFKVRHYDGLLVAVTELCIQAALTVLLTSTPRATHEPDLLY